MKQAKVQKRPAKVDTILKEGGRMWLRAADIKAPLAWPKTTYPAMGSIIAAEFLDTGL
jgi:hypothetical protein